MNFVYIDNAATSYPKPKSVISAMNEALVKRGGNPGRSGHELSLLAARDIYNCREKAAAFFGREKVENVIVTSGSTAALNITLKSLIERGDNLLCSDIEHNAVRRVIKNAVANGSGAYNFESSDEDNETLLNVEKMIKRTNPKLLVCNHASNVFPRILPIEEIGKLCRKYGVFFVVDAAQSAGHLPVNCDKFGIDALCVPGHKGLYGPPGIGLAIVSDRFADYIKGKEAFFQGGSGSDSLNERMPDYLPEHFEAGTIPSFLCAGLKEGIDFVASIGLDYIQTHIKRLCGYAECVLSSKPGVILYGKGNRSCGVVSFNIKDMDSETAANELSKRKICTRGGFHCAPDAHKCINTLQIGGSVRASFGIFNSLSDVQKLSAAIDEITR